MISEINFVIFIYSVFKLKPEQANNPREEWVYIGMELPSGKGSQWMNEVLNI